MSRYLVALIADEMQLTFDLWCSEVSCRINLASQCLEDEMRIIDYPVAIEMQSNLICRYLVIIFIMSWFYWNNVYFITKPFSNEFVNEVRL
jgi:hypothetical protein